MPDALLLVRLQDRRHFGAEILDGLTESVFQLLGRSSAFFFREQKT